MIRFNCDYSEGAHPRIIDALTRTNMEQTPGYGEDPHCENAANIIREMCGRADLGVHFLVGGTQANFTVLAAMLRPYQGVLCCDTGHINVHESGAVEATGHKVMPIASTDGRLTGDMVRAACRAHFGDETHEHMVMPGAVYISDATEIGTVYTRSILEDLRRACDEYSLYLYLDGARLGYAMASDESDITFADLARLCDAFYIGGTKQGAMFGEAVVLPNIDIEKNFRYIMKQKGAMLAKGRLLGIQFEELLKDGLYMDLSRHAVGLAMRIRDAALQRGYTLYAQSPTNQQFIIMPDRDIERLSRDFAFAYIARVNNHYSAVRFCTSWATRPEDVETLISAILS